MISDDEKKRLIDLAEKTPSLDDKALQIWQLQTLGAILDELMKIRKKLESSI